MAVSVSDLVEFDLPPVDGASDPLHALLGVPEGSGPWPAVVVVHEAFGIEGEMRKQVAHLASLGYLALMPDLFSQGGARRCLVATMRALRSGEGRAYRDIESARQWLVAEPRSTGRVGVIGFCMGGGFALMTASQGFEAASVNYGMLPTDLDVALENACPVVASYGGRDPSLRGAAAKLTAALERRGIDHDVVEYPEASHAFLNEAPTGPAFFRPIARVMNFGPHPESARDAWARIDGFLRAHLTTPAT